MKVSSIEKFLTAGSKVRVTVMLKDTNNRAESGEIAMKLMQEIRDQVRCIMLLQFARSYCITVTSDMRVCHLHTGIVDVTPVKRKYRLTQLLSFHDYSMPHTHTHVSIYVYAHIS